MVTMTSSTEPVKSRDESLSAQVTLLVAIRCVLHRSENERTPTAVRCDN
jgi:hypothetical protein